LSPSTREPTFTGSPMIVYFTRERPPMLPANTSPEWMPIPIRRSGSPRSFHVAFSSWSAASIASAACTACSACSRSASGAPKTAMTASPTKSLIVPRERKIAAIMASKYSLSSAAIRSGGVVSDSVVKPRRSEKRTEMSRRSPRRLGASASTCATTSLLTYRLNAARKRRRSRAPEPTPSAHVASVGSRKSTQ